MIEWERILETFVGAGAGAGVIVSIDYLIRYYLENKKNFHDAISIQVALNQMLSISLQIRQFNDKKKAFFLNLYSDISNDPNFLWSNFRHIDLPSFLNTFDVIKSDWNFTQFLTKNDNNVRNILKRLIPIKLGFESIMYMCELRNNMLLNAQPHIDKKQIELKSEFYRDGVLEKCISISDNIRLQSVTNEYIEKIDQVIYDCNDAFNVLSKYISENFRNYEPLILSIHNNLKVLLDQVNEDESKKRLETENVHK